MEEMSSGSAAVSGGSEGHGAETQNQDGRESEQRKAEGQKEQSRRPNKPKMRQIKVDGRDEFVNEDEVFRNYSKYQAADSKLREASRKEAESQKFLERLKSDPDAVLRDPNLSLNRRELAMKWLEEELENEVKPKDPRDTKLKALEERLKSYEDRDADAKKKADDEEKGKFVESRKQAISQKFADALKLTKLSANPRSAAAALREMAVYTRAAKEAGEDPTPEELASHIESGRMEEFYVLAHQFEGDDLLDFLGDEVVKRVGRALVEKRRKAMDVPAQSYRSTERYEQKKNPSQGKFIDPSDMRLSLRSER